LTDLSAQGNSVTLKDRQRDFWLAVTSRQRPTAQMRQICRHEGRAMPVDEQLPDNIFSCPGYHQQPFYRTEIDETDPWRQPQEFWRFALGLERSAAA